MTEAESGNSDNLEARPPQRARMELTPLPTAKPSSLYLNSLREILLSDLLEEDNEIEMSHLKYVTLQLLRIITYDQSKTQAFVRNRHNRGIGNRQPQQQAYTRMFLCCVVTLSSSPDAGKVVYLMQSKSDNNHLWTYYPTERDSGVITIGTVFRLVNVQMVEQEIGNIPVLKSGSPAVVMIPPKTYVLVPVFQGVQADETKAFVFNEAKITVLNTTPFSTVCGGHFCDKQKCEEISNLGAKCGCYNMNTMRGNTVFGHNIKVKIPDLSFVHRNFSSAKFTKLYVNGDLSSAVKVDEFQGSDAMIILSNRASETVKHINEHGGWTVIGWYRRGTITDRVLMGSLDSNAPNESATTSGNISYHIVRMFPTKPENAIHESRQFDVSTLNVHSQHDGQQA